ncbi:pentatricopeptide repeat-containing protein, mitochondrial [Favolaschia claudopus]|uniref:Pentatricopeptide repeat-containing protein, mitochondrial n=1 Tax=Favolaschia claudopus TaxID=2862362 RepID=A0AAW0EIE1_9AGAR
MLASSSRWVACIPSSSARIAVRAAFVSSKNKSKNKVAKFPPKQASLPPPFTEQNGAVDPVAVLQLRQHIIERHNPSSEEMDESRLQLVNRLSFNLKEALDKQDIPLIRKSWEELRRAKYLHILTPPVLQQTSRLLTSLLPRDSLDKQWDSGRRSFVEEVALAAAAVDSTDALNTCVATYLRLGYSTAVVELFEKFRHLPNAQESSDLLEGEAADDTLELIPSRAHSGRANLLLAAIAAYAQEGSFQKALKVFLDTNIHCPTQAVEEFSKTLSYDPILRTRFDVYIRRLELAKSVSRPGSLSKHISNLAKRSVPVLEELYNSILEAMTGPDAFIASDAKFITSTAPVALTEATWASFLSYFLRREQNDRAAALWKDMAKFGIRPGVVTWNMVLKVYSDRGAIDQVLVSWRTMTAQGVKPDGMTCRILMSCLFEAKRTAEALQWFKTFQADIEQSCSIEQSLLVYNAVLHPLLHLGRKDAEIAFQIFKRMQSHGPAPDVVSYNTMLSYAGRQGDFRAMAATISEMGSAGVVGDVFTFSTILSALLKVGRADAPQMVVNIMRKQGVKANVATYGAIIQWQMEEQTVEHLRAALALLDEMEKDAEVKPNEITYTSVLAGLYRGSWLSGEQLAWYKEDIKARMKKMNVTLRAGGYNILIRGCLREPNGLEDALGYFREMRRNRVTLSEDTWYILLSGLLGREEWEVAREIVDEMFSSGAQPGERVLRLANKIRKRQG